MFPRDISPEQLFRQLTTGGVFPPPFQHSLFPPSSGQFPPFQHPLFPPSNFHQEEDDLQQALQRSLLEGNEYKDPHDITNNDRRMNDRSYDNNNHDRGSGLDHGHILGDLVDSDGFEEIEDAYDPKIDRDNGPRETNGGGRDRNFYDDIDGDTELKKVLQLSEKEFQPPTEKRNLVEKDINSMTDVDDDLLEFALSQSKADEKLRREEQARVEEEARAKEAAILEKQQQEEMELERALLLSKEQEERDARQRLLEEQDQAYQESLARDKAKEEQQRQDEERLKWEQLAKEKEEEDRELEDAIHLSESLSHMSQKERDIRRRLAELPPEPAESDPSAVHLVFQLPSGIRIERSFRLNNTFYEVKIFVDSRTLEEFGGCKIPENYNLVTDFPRRVWDNVGIKLSDAGFRKRQLVRVEGV